MTLACNQDFMSKKNGRTAKRGADSLDRFVRRDDVETVCCILHNMGGQCAGNTQASDVEWFARWLYGSSNFGAGSVDTFQWSLSNREFEVLGLLPDRQWTGYRWETLPPKRKAAWMKLSRLCLYALPHIAERIGHRFMEQSKALRIANSSNAEVSRPADGKDK